MALFPSNQNTVLAIIDTIAGIGYVVDPIIGDCYTIISVGLGPGLSQLASHSSATLLR